MRLEEDPTPWQQLNELHRPGRGAENKGLNEETASIT